MRAMTPALLARLARRSATLLLATMLSACGGGGGGDTPGNGGQPGAQQGSLSLSFSGGAATGFTHVWVTVRSVALNTDPDKPWSASDTSWQVVQLATPQTVDLASLTNGLVGTFIVGQVVPAGTYGQLRIFLSEHDSELTAQAKTLNLLYNEQVDYTDAAGVAQHVPLELPEDGLGLRVQGPIVIPSNDLAQVTLQWDLAHNLVRLAGSDGVDHFTLRPDLRPLLLSSTAAIVGLLDKTPFCPANAPADNCIHDAVATALMPSPDGRYEREVRSAPVILDDAGAKFALYPLPVGTSVDVVIRGRNMQTMVVLKVPAVPQDLLQAPPTQLGANPNDHDHPTSPMVPVLRPEGDARVTLASPMAERSAQLVFVQTLPSAGALPMEIGTVNVDPFTGLPAQPVALGSGPLLVSTYTATDVLRFSEVVPAEGSNHYQVSSLGTRYEDPGAFTTFAAAGGSTVSLVAPEPTARPGLATATLTVNLTGGTAAKFDSAQLVVSDVNGIVATRDVSALIGSGGSVALPLPGGAAAAALGGTAVYAVEVRAWKKAAPSSSLQWSRSASQVDLRGGSAASATLALP